jgi:hypothetical protein
MQLSKVSLLIAAILIALGAWFIFSQPAGNGSTELSGDKAGSGSSSETSFDADLGALDSQLQALEQDAADVDASFNDTPVEQTE